MTIDSTQVSAPTRSRRYAVSTFFALACLITWLIWLPGIAFSRGLIAWEPPASVHMLGSLGPGLAALILLSAEGGPAAVQAWLRRFVRWRVGLRWYVVVAAPVVMVAGLVALLSRLSGIAPALGPDMWLRVLGAVLFNLVLGGPLGEEGGWRGYALPRLQANRSPLSASLLLGLVWFVWHAPGLWDPRNPLGQPAVVPVYLLLVLAMSVLLAWLYNHTQGSLLLAVLLHATINMGGYAVPLFFPTTPASELAPYMTLVSLVYFALPILVALMVVITSARQAGGGK